MRFSSTLQPVRISCSEQWPLNYYCTLSRPPNCCIPTSSLTELNSVAKIEECMTCFCRNKYLLSGPSGVPACFQATALLFFFICPVFYLASCYYILQMQLCHHASKGILRSGCITRCRPMQGQQAERDLLAPTRLLPLPSPSAPSSLLPLCTATVPALRAEELPRGSR